MAELIISPAAGKYFKKIKDKNLKCLFKDAIDEIVADPTVEMQKWVIWKGFSDIMQ